MISIISLSCLFSIPCFWVNRTNSVYTRLRTTFFRPGVSPFLEKKTSKNCRPSYSGPSTFANVFSPSLKAPPVRVYKEGQYVLSPVQFFPGNSPTFFPKNHDQNLSPDLICVPPVSYKLTVRIPAYTVFITDNLESSAGTHCINTNRPDDSVNSRRGW